MLNAAVIGLGWWGKTLVESVQGTSDEITFTAAVTRTGSDDARAFAEQYRMRTLDDLDAVLADEQVDAVVLATPHSLHAAQVSAAARAGKHVFCEKPFALTKAEAEAAVDAVTQRRCDARSRVQPALSSRDGETARQRPVWGAGCRDACRGDDDVPERAEAQARAVAS